MTERNFKNRDFVKRLNYPRQTYAITGTDRGDAEDAIRTRGKLQINNAPSIITPLTPGANARSDESWQQIYGASQDAYLSLLDGDVLNDNILESANNFPTLAIRDGLPLADNSNLYDVSQGRQQVSFIVGRDSVSDFRASGPIEAFEARSLAIRSPMHMAGWGKTIAMRPTDPDPEDKRLNDVEHKYDRSTWETGPVDLRWDSRRKVWRGFNDLIADDNNENLGTFVFSTNPDDFCGFPFLRGKLEDVWSVRKLYNDQGTEAGARNDDTTKSASVVTKLEGRALLDNKVAKWSNVLSITDACFTKGLNATCGSETTTDAEMVILTTAKFFQSQGAIGPIDFTAAPPADDVILGSMYFQGAGCGQWVPGIAVGDICTLAATEFGITWSNDQSLQDGIIDLCDDGVAVNRDIIKDILRIIDTGYGAIADISDATADGFESIDAAAATKDDVEAEVNGVLFSTVPTIINAVQSAINSLASALISEINNGFAAIALQLAIRCDCEIPGYVAEIPAIGVPSVAIELIDLTENIGLSTEIAEIRAKEDIVTAEEEKAEIILQGLEEDGDTTITINITEPCDPTNTISKSCTF